MRVLYDSEIIKGEEEVKINKMIETNNITFYPDKNEIQIGHWYYMLENAEAFETVVNTAVTENFLDLRGFDFYVPDYQQPERQRRTNYNRQQHGNNRKYNKGGYRRSW